MIWPDQLILDPQGIITFGKLNTVNIHDCSSLKSVFPTSVAKALKELERLEIKDCAMVEEIIAKEEGIETTTLFVFPRLSSLYLESLPELKSFYPGKHTSEWPLLNELIIYKCDKLKIFGSNKSSVEETNGLGHHGSLILQPLFFVEKVRSNYKLQLSYFFLSVFILFGFNYFYIKLLLFFNANMYTGMTIYA